MDLDNLRKLYELYEDLTEALSPSDVQQLSQAAWLLWEKHSDLKHKLAIRMQIIKARTERIKLFDTQNKRIHDWIEKTEKNICQQEESLPDLVFRMNNVYKNDIENKQKDLMSLHKLKEQIAEDQWQEVEDISEKLNETKTKYENLKKSFETRLSKLTEIHDSQLSLETELQEVSKWLAEIETKLNEPLPILGLSPTSRENNEMRMNELETEIKENTDKVCTTVDKGKTLLNDIHKSSNDHFKISNDIDDIESRWENLCTINAKRREKSDEAWNKLQQFIEQYRTLNDWLDARLSINTFGITQIKLADCKTLQKDLDNIMMDLNDSLNTLDEFNSLYCDLTKTGKLDENGKIKEMHSDINEKWEKLSSLTKTNIKHLAEKKDTFESYFGFHDQEMTWIRQIDAQLTEIQYSSSLEDEIKIKRLIEIQTFIEGRKVKIDNLLATSTEVLNQCNEDDNQCITSSVQELTLLHDDVQQRLSKLLDDLCVDENKHQDQNIQVDTLKFEQDRSVQADTLSLQIPDSGVYLSNITSPATPDELPDLEKDVPVEISLSELDDKSPADVRILLDETIHKCKEQIPNVEDSLEITDDVSFLVIFFNQIF